MARAAGEDDDRRVLFQLGGGSWARELGWLGSTKEISGWKAVTTENGRVVSLTVNKSLKGTSAGKAVALSAFLIPVSESLEYRKELSGPIPRELAGLVCLRVLTLSKHKLTGPIPKEIAKLVNLEKLLMDNNLLTGKIPYELDELEALYCFDCTGNAGIVDAPGKLKDREAVRQWQESMAPRREEAAQQAAERRQAEAALAEAAAKKSADEVGVPFFEVLSAFENAKHPAELLGLLRPLISSVPELQLYFTLACAACRNGVIDATFRNDYLRDGLRTVAGKAVSLTEETMAVFRAALKRAKELGAIDSDEKNRLDCKAMLKLVEGSAMIRDMRMCIQANAEAIRRLERRVDAHEDALSVQERAIMTTVEALEKFRMAYRKKLSYESTIGSVKLVLNAFSFGIAGGLLDVALAGIVDFSDLDTISQCLSLRGLDLFDPLFVLEAATNTSAMDAVFGGVQDRGDRDIEEAVQGDIVIKVLAVAAASCAGGGRAVGSGGRDSLNGGSLNGGRDSINGGSVNGGRDGEGCWDGGGGSGGYGAYSGYGGQALERGSITQSDRGSFYDGGTRAYGGDGDRGSDFGGDGAFGGGDCCGGGGDGGSGGFRAGSLRGSIHGNSPAPTSPRSAEGSINGSIASNRSPGPAAGRFAARAPGSSIFYDSDGAPRYDEALPPRGSATSVTSGAGRGSGVPRGASQYSQMSAEPRLLKDMLAGSRLSALEPILAEAGFETFEALQGMLEEGSDGKQNFLAAMENDVGIKKVGERLELWRLVTMN